MFANAFLTSLGICIPVACLLLLAYFLFVYLKREEQRRKMVLENRMDLTELFAALEVIIVTEENLYEQYLKTNTDTDITTLTNSEMTNIYRDLSMRCLKAVSPAFWDAVEVYMTREAVQTYITQRVMQYLTDKIQAA